MAATGALSASVGGYFREVYRTVRTILIGLKITLRYNFAKTVTVQYPDVPPVCHARFRGFHWFQIEKCIGCDMCAKACPVDCIYIEKTGARKIDKESGIARGGAMTRFAIDYSKCMFCSLCIEPCPTDCIHMGDSHDLSGYDRRSMVVEFTDLARQGLQTPQPLWMTHPRAPSWAHEKRRQWDERVGSVREEMIKALSDSTPPKPPPKPAAAPAAPDPAAGS
ncbi:MAG: NADH-quinone oxidoreductase subunit I [Planctomycetes bacterium]|nr:NADH-quinone oxidoreductase subunit I [Planctomycetota bacterium]